jgi:hypothetical protein
LRGRTKTAFTPYKRKRKGENTVSTPMRDKNMYIALGATDVKELSNAWFHVKELLRKL